MTGELEMVPVVLEHSATPLPNAAHANTSLNLDEAIVAQIWSPRVSDHPIVKTIVRLFRVQQLK